MPQGGAAKIVGMQATLVHVAEIVTKPDLGYLSTRARDHKNTIIGVSPGGARGSSMDQTTLLTANQIRKALIWVLEKDGHENLEWINGELWAYRPTTHPDYIRLRKLIGKKKCPRYDRDLNAIVERVGRLDENQKIDWYRHLHKVIVAGRPLELVMKFEIPQALASLRLWALYQTMKGNKT